VLSSSRFLVVASVLATRVVAAQGDPATQKTFFVPRDAGVAAAFVATSAGLSVFDVRLAHFFRDTAHSHVRAGQRLDGVFTHINETTLTVGGLAIYAVARLANQQTIADVAFHATESVVAASLSSQVIRGPLGRTRPLNTTPEFQNQYSFKFLKGFEHFENRAFPSIHSSSGFAAASAIVAEVQRRDPSAAWFVGVPLYGLALTPGLARMYLGQHWASDIVSGAFLGTFYGWRIVNYSHQHWTPMDRAFLGSADRARIGRRPRTAALSWTIAF
jgi:membrane-associated phospholipid phosphatase